MAPINLPNGNEVSEIVLPNGQTASEVIAPDGSTVFSAIPDSAVLHWPISAGSGSTVTEEIGTYGDQDGTINGGSWVEDSNWWGGTYINNDNVDDTIPTGKWGSFGSSVLNGDVCYIIEAQLNDSVLLVKNTSSPRVFIGSDDYTAIQTGAVGFRYRDSGSNDIRFATSSTGFTDGNRHFVAIQLSNLDPTTGQIYIDDGFKNVDVDQQQGSTAEDLGNTVHLGSDTNGKGTPTGRVLVCNTTFTESELDDIASQHGFGP